MTYIFRSMRRIASHVTGFMIVFGGLLGMAAFDIQSVYAQPQPGTFSAFTIPQYCNEHECGWRELLLLGGEVLKFAIFISIIGATVTFMLAGFKLIMNQGNSGEISSAKDMMTKTAIGIIVTMVAWLMVNFILNQLGVTAEFRGLGIYGSILYFMLQYTYESGYIST